MVNYFKERAFSRHHRVDAYALAETERMHKTRASSSQTGPQQGGGAREHSVPPVDK